MSAADERRPEAGGPLTRRSFITRTGALAAAVPALRSGAFAEPAGRRRPWRVPVAVQPQEAPLHVLEVWEAADLLRRGAVSPVELAEATLARIEAVEPRVLAFANRYPADEVLAQARRAADEIASGGYRGPLHGIPVGVKDICLTEGKVTEGNSKLYTGFVPSFDATVVARLKAAGAVIVGKAGTSELATGSAWPARNPWDLDRSPGGSSSGSAAGVAASEFLIGIGTDTGGSIRGPAANCGLTGFKPTYGTVSLHGVLPLAWSMDHVGPLARSARDAALLVDALGGDDPLDPHTRKVAGYRLAEGLAWEPAGRPLEGVVVGVPAEDDYLLGVPNDEEVAAFREATDVIRSLGATLRTVRTRVLMPGLTSTTSFYVIIRSAEVAAYQYENLLTQPENMSGPYLSRVSSGVLMPGHAYAQAQRVRRLWRDRLLTVFDEVDVLLHPADDIAGIRRDELEDLRDEGEDPEDDSPPARPSSGSKTNIWNLSGAPAVAVPTGFSSAENMPLSMQVAAYPGRDGIVLRVADAFQQATAHHRARATP